MHKLCEKCEKSSWCKLGTYEYMHLVLNSGCDGFHEKGKSKSKGKANPSAYHIGYAEGQRDAEQIKNAHLLQRATSAEAMLTATENKAAEYKSWAAKAVKENEELRARVEELEAKLHAIQSLSPPVAYTSFDSKVIELDYSDYCDYCQKIKELTEVALKKKAGEK